MELSPQLIASLKFFNLKYTCFNYEVTAHKTTFFPTPRIAMKWV